MIGRSGLHMQHSGLNGAHRSHAHEKNTKEPVSDEEQNKQVQNGSEEKEVKPSPQTTKPSTPAEAELTYEQLKQVQQLQARDQEVRAHEAAHAAVGGQYAGSPSYSYQKGPDGRSYAVGGEVSISVSAEPTPEATIRKMEIVRRAALAPAEPSPQDRQVAQAALATKAQAIAELAAENGKTTEEGMPLRIKGQEDESDSEKGETQTNGASTNEAESQKTPGQLKAEQLFDISPAKPAKFSVQA